MRLRDVTQYSSTGPAKAKELTYLVITPDGYTGRSRVPLVVAPREQPNTAEQEDPNDYDQVAEVRVHRDVPRRQR